MIVSLGCKECFNKQADKCYTLLLSSQLQKKHTRDYVCKMQSIPDNTCCSHPVMSFYQSGGVFQQHACVFSSRSEGLQRESIRSASLSLLHAVGFHEPRTTNC